MTDWHLLVAFYDDPDPVRAAELAECLRRNAAHPGIAAIHVLGVAGAPFVDRKLQVVPLARRLTYRDALDHAARALPGLPAILANADIYFDETLAALDGLDLAGRMVCLSRWDVHGDGVSRHFAHAGSQDAWMFLSPP